MKKRTSNPIIKQLLVVIGTAGHIDHGKSTLVERH
jgi:translation initiation factor 2 gamma subunit (eIF-2gamma)